MKLLAAFPKMSEFEKMRQYLDSLSLPYEIIDPAPGYSLVGCPVIAVEPEARGALAAANLGNFISSGWVDYRKTAIRIPEIEPPSFAEDLFGPCSIMVIAPCIADATKIRLIAHLSGDVNVALPYLNAEMPEGCYNPDGESFTFMDGYRMITLYPRRMTVAKADDIVDGWRTLERMRCRVNEVYSRRASIEPLYEMRKKPPALEIYKRLPGTNCGMCGQKTCMAFALTLWNGAGRPSQCKQIFSGDYPHLEDAFREICARIGSDDFNLFQEMNDF